MAKMAFEETENLRKQFVNAEAKYLVALNKKMKKVKDEQLL